MARHINDAVGIDGSRGATIEAPIEMTNVDGVYQRVKETGSKVGTAIKYTGYGLMLLGALAMAGGSLTGCATARKVNNVMMQKVGPIIPGASNMWYEQTATGKVTNVNDDLVLQNAYVKCRDYGEGVAFWKKRGSDRIYINSLTGACLRVRHGYIPVPAPRK